MSARERVDVLVVGAGQAGLATAAELRQVAPEARLLVVDGADRVGDSWRQRWDSLRLFTPRAYSALPGLPFPDGPHECPDRLEMAAYLETYAEHFALSVRTRTRVTHFRTGEGPCRFRAETDGGTVLARHVVLAPGPFAEPYVPPAGALLAPDVAQVHSGAYRRPGDLPDGPVVVVGGGNSAAQLALELALTRPATRRSTPPVTLVAPREPWLLPAHVLGVSIYRWLSALRLLQAPADGRAARHVRRRGDPVIGRELGTAVRRGTVALRTSRVTGAADRALLLADGTSVPVRSVLWCTGFRPRWAWLDLPGALDTDGAPRHERGASPLPGLHWVGLPWQSRLDSSIVHGVGADARRTATRIAAEVAGTCAPPPADRGPGVGRATSGTITR